MGSSNQVELGSGGTNDVDEYYWTITGLKTGWNLISLKLRDAAKSGNPDLTAINWFRLYNDKSGTVRTRIDEIQILDFGATSPKLNFTVNNGSGSGQYLEDTELNVMLDIPPDGFKFNGWQVNSGNALILEPFKSSTTVYLFDEDSEITAGYQVAGDYLDDCDALEDWSGSSLILNTNDKKEGLGCLEFSGLSTDEYIKQFATPYQSIGNESNSVLSFWYYLSDSRLVRATNEVEIGSAGMADTDEYNWTLTGLVSGWNFIELNISDANKIGNPDLSAINWFRFYQFKRSSVTTRIDAIQLSGGSLSTNDNEQLISLKVFPNPTKNNINLLFNLNNQSLFKIQVFNTLGQEIIGVSQQGKLYPGSQNLEIKTNSLTTGIYFLKLTLEGQSIVKRIIKQ